MRIYAMSEMPDITLRAIHGDTWGDWVFDEKVLALCWKSYDGWYVDLENLRNSAQLADSIFQAATHSYDITALVKALRDPLNPQMHLCSSGVDCEFDPTEWLRRPETDKDVSAVEFRRLHQEFRDRIANE